MSLPPERLKTHALFVGATGSGKTNAFHHLMAQDVLLGHSFAVLDLRGDLVAAALEICAGRVDPRLVKIINLREKARPTGFDPLSGKGEPYYRALSVLDAIEAGNESWGPQLAEFMRKAFLLLAATGGKLTDLESLFFDREALLRRVGACREESLAAFWRRFDELSEDRKAALAPSVLNKLGALLCTPTLRAILGHPAPLDLRHHLDTPGSVTLVSLAADETHSSGRMMGRLVLSSLCREAFSRVEVSESRRNPVRLYVDEFENFILPEFETVLAEGRRFGLSLVLAHQTLSQLSPRMRSLVLGNVGTKVFFRCGREDSATLSKDLTGDPKALDLTGQPVGEAVVWTRQEGHRHVEFNSPIIRDVGTPSFAAQRFIERIKEASGPIIHPPAPESDPISSASEASGSGPGSTAKRARVVPPPPKANDDWEGGAGSSGHGKGTPKSDLEDWLCG